MKTKDIRLHSDDELRKIMVEFHLKAVPKDSPFRFLVELAAMELGIEVRPIPPEPSYWTRVPGIYQDVKCVGASLKPYGM